MRPQHRTTLLVCAVALATMLPFLPSAFAANPAGPDHVVVVVMENRDRTEVIGNPAAPYENALAALGVDYANAQGVTHPSLGNYLELYSGSTQGQAGKDPCVRLGADNLGRTASASGISLKVYVEGLGTLSPLADHGSYACRHNPAAQFNDAANNAASADLAAFPTDYTRLPRISFVIPNLCNDTHDCGVPTGDAWLQANLDGYVQWARSHNSVLVLTWDENHHSTDYTTPMPTVVVGAGITHSVQGARVTQDHILRTMEDWFGLPRLGNSANVNGLPGLPAFTAAPSPTTTPTGSPAPTLTPTPSAGTFGAGFAPSPNANAWWVEVKVTSTHALSSVQATVNGGPPHALAATAWGTYAASFNAPAGSAVVFTARDTAGASAVSPTFGWLTGTTASATGTPSATAPAFTATFTPKAVGNDWWVETTVATTQGLAKVEAKVGAGAWTTLPTTAWGSYARSLPAPNGVQVSFRATATTGAIASGPTVTWP